MRGKPELLLRVDQRVLLLSHANARCVCAARGEGGFATLAEFTEPHERVAAHAGPANRRTVATKSRPAWSSLSSRARGCAGGDGALSSTALPACAPVRLIGERAAVDPRQRRRRSRGTVERTRWRCGWGQGQRPRRDLLQRRPARGFIGFLDRGSRLRGGGAPRRRATRCSRCGRAGGSAGKRVSG